MTFAYGACGHPLRRFSFAWGSGFEPCRVCSLVSLRSWECYELRDHDVAGLQERMDAERGEWRSGTFHPWTSKAEANSYRGQPRNIGRAAKDEAHSRRRQRRDATLVPSAPIGHTSRTVPFHMPRYEVGTENMGSPEPLHPYMKPRTFIPDRANSDALEPTYPLVRHILDQRIHDLIEGNVQAIADINDAFAVAARESQTFRRVAEQLRDIVADVVDETAPS